jgi:hypothetical protein
MVGKRAHSDAVTVVEGYAVCETHLPHLAQGTRWKALQDALKTGRGYTDTSGEF